MEFPEEYRGVVFDTKGNVLYDIDNRTLEAYKPKAVAHIKELSQDYIDGLDIFDKNFQTNRQNAIDYFNKLKTQVENSKTLEECDQYWWPVHTEVEAAMRKPWWQIW